MLQQPVSKSLQNKLRNERHNTLDGFRAQLQINDELRTMITDIRAAVPLEFRRDTHARNLSSCRRHAAAVAPLCGNRP